MKTSEPTIQVGILSKTTIEFVLNGAYKTTNGRIVSGRQTAEYKDGEVGFSAENTGEIIFEPLSADASFDLMEVVIGIGFHWERKENQRFRGGLKIIVENHMLTAINMIRVEDYLTSVISSEMSATASEELLKAHAVISRSWLLCPLERGKRQEVRIEEYRGMRNEQMSKIRGKKPTTNDQQPTINYKLQTTNYINKWYERDAHAHFDVCADDHCQRYQGITRAGTEAVEAAMEATRGEVLMYEGRICDARFSKSCGGATELFENCWAEEHYPYLTKVMDHPTSPAGYELDLTREENAEKWIRNWPEAFCNTTDKLILAQVLNNYDQETTDFYRWKVEYSQEELSELLSRRSGIDFGGIIGMTPVKRGESGRIIELEIVGAKRTAVVGKELEIRKWLSNSHLYSSAFVVDTAEIIEGLPQHFTLTGAGWGHGVGLCQIGAAVMGEQGYNYRDILLHYFRGAELKRIY